jgi:anti-anti-sigma factor
MDRVDDVPPELEEPLVIEARAEGDETVLILKGELDPHTAPRLGEELDKARAEGSNQIVLDLAELGFIDSSGLRVIISAHKAAAADGGQLVLRSPSPMARRLLDITGLLDHIEVRDVT